MVKNMKTPPPKGGRQLGLEEEVISYTHIDDKNMSVFSSSILTVEYISKNGAWPYMGRKGEEVGEEREKEEGEGVLENK